MLIKDGNRPLRLIVAAPLLLFVGFAVGVLWRSAANAEPGGGADPAAPAGDRGPFDPDPTSAVAAAASLPALHVAIDADGVDRLQRDREAALRRGGIVQDEGSTVRATLHAAGAGGVGDRRVRADVRLKGDWTDHVETDKWSFRFELRDGELFGMSRFSVQHPKTRAWLMEWLILEMARREGLLAPRTEYVNLVVNGVSRGVYFLEEHFTKEMLESQGRREGPIVKMREDTLWSVWLQHDFGKTGSVPLPVIYGTSPWAPDLSAFDESRLFRIESLTARLQRSLEQLRALQLRLLASWPVLPNTLDPIPVQRMEAYQTLAGRTVDELVASDRVGAMLAIASLFRADHGLAPHQYRYYHDPVRDRLEPIVFDMGPPYAGGNPELLLTHVALRDFTRSDTCHESGFATLRRICAPEYLAEFFAAVGGDYRRYWSALDAEGLLPPDFDVDAPRRLLEASAAHIRHVAAPADPANYAARLVEVREGDADPVRMLEVEAWATSAVPVFVDGFRFGNGRVVRAASAVAPGSPQRRPSGEVALPRAGRHLRFLFPIDVRLQRLRDVQEIKRAIREVRERDPGAKLQVEVLARGAMEAVPRAERLRIRDFGEGDAGRGRPAAPSLLDALQAQPCLGYDLEFDLLYVRPGAWEIEGDLVLPAGFTVHARPGTTLRFAPGAALVSSSPLQWLGAVEQPIVLEPRDEAAGWAGVIVLETAEQSRWQHVEVRGTTGLARGGWQTTGGVTFYHAPVEMVGCRLLDCRGEDALNVFGTSCTLRDTVFDGGASDLFDGDFVRAVISGGRFANSVEDAIDVSGSELSVERVEFDAIGDKALSIGERSVATARDLRVGTASIGAAVKDLSRLTIESFAIERAEQFAIAAFVKKSEYGPSVVEIRGLTVGSAGRARLLVQEGCTVHVDGEPVAGVPVDVEELYRQKVLGK